MGQRGLYLQTIYIVEFDLLVFARYLKTAGAIMLGIFFRITLYGLQNKLKINRYLEK